MTSFPLDPPRASTLWRERVATAVPRFGEALATPLVPADYLDLISPLRAGTSLRARVLEVHRETKDAVTLVLKPGRDWAGHRPGQYLRLGIDVDGVRLWRAYSLTSLVSEPRRISVTIKAIADGTVSNHLHGRIKPGTLLHLEQAMGEFTLPADPGPTVFVTAGSGITPVMGILRNHLGRDLTDVVLVHAAPSRDDVIFGAELRQWAAAGRLRLVEHHDDVAGLLDVATLDQIVPDLATRRTYACGPVGLLDALEERYSAWGLTDSLYTERFRPTVIVAGEGGDVSFGRGQTTVYADGAKPLLEVGEEAGVLMKSGCRMGICFGCVLPLREGAVRDLRDGTITTAVEGDNVVIQTCISAAAGACHLGH